MIFYASMMELLGNGGKVIGVDIDIRSHNRAAIESHPMMRNIELIEGSSIDTATFEKVKKLIPEGKKVLINLDSNHTHAHVLKELELYSTLVMKDSYIVCEDTAIEYVPEEFSGPRPWGKGNNPLTAVREFMKHTDRFVIDEKWPNKVLLSASPDGFLRCIK